MSRSRVVPVLVAVLAVSALGVAATTLEASLTTDPDDAIDPDWDRLPIGEGDVATVHEEMNGDAGESERQAGGEESGDATGDRGTEAGEGAAAEGNPEGDAEDGERQGDIGIDGNTAGDGDERGSETDEGSGVGGGSGTGMATGLGLVAPLPLLWSILTFLSVLAAAAVAYRYRSVLFGRQADDDDGDEPTAATDPWPPEEPSNAVDRAWVTMMQRLDPERPETTTPAEWVALARERGADVEGVEAITTAFERVHYGGVAVAEEEPRARAGLRRIDGEDG